MFTLPKSTGTTKHPLSIDSHQTGLSLIELMVGVFIGMLTVLAVAASVIHFEGQRRGTASGNDAQVSATYAAYFIERDLRRAGYGLIGESGQNVLSKCTKGIVAVNKEKGEEQFTFSSKTSYPIEINPATGFAAPDENTDLIVINYSNSGLGGFCTQIFQKDSGANIKVDDRNCFRTGDLSVLVPIQSASCSSIGTDLSSAMAAIDTTEYCSVIEITGLPADKKCAGDGGSESSKTKVVLRNTGKYESAYNNCEKTSPNWNIPGGLDNPDTGAKLDYGCGIVVNLGNTIVSMAYAVRSGKLTQCNVAQADCSVVSSWETIADDIVSLTADIGFSNSVTSQAVTTWRKTLCNTTTCSSDAALVEALKELKLVRIGLLARSPHYQKTAITPNQPTWSWGATAKIEAVKNLDATEWSHYRYAPIEVTVPLRNVIWNSQ